LNHPSAHDQTVHFQSMGLDYRLLKTINHLGFTHATSIQQQAVPIAMHGKDLIASSKTGSGKTLAYVLPALNRCLTQKALSRRDPRVLILAPTRELARQVYAQVRLFTSNTALKSTCIVGGDNFNDQVKALQRQPHIIVATAGRLADHLEHRSVFLNGLELLILDEADRMLDLGFEAALRRIHNCADHKKRQTCLFSATLDHASVNLLANELLSDPVRIKIGEAAEKHQDIEQSFFFADHYDHKIDLLAHHLKELPIKQVMIFTATRDHTEQLAQHLEQQGYRALPLSGKLSQAKRHQIMDDFSRNKYQVLVTTDVASRGLDIHTVSHVINFDLPKHEEEYIHRVGRTGRAGQKGAALSYIGPKDWDAFTRLKALLEQALEMSVVAGLEAQFSGFKPRKQKKAKAVSGSDKKTKAAIGQSSKKKSKKPRNKDFYLAQDAGEAPVKRKPKTSD